MYVLESTGANPLTGTWTERGRIVTPLGHVLAGRHHVRRERRALPGLGAVRTRHRHQLQPLHRPDGQPVDDHRHGHADLACPRWPGRRRGYRVNEGPAVIQRNGRVFMTYSASATDANYCLGLLTASAVGRPAQRRRPGRRAPNPVFASNAAHQPVRAGPQLVHRLRGRPERHPRLPRPQLPGHQRRPAQRPEPAHPASRSSTGTPTAPRTSASRSPTASPRCGCGRTTSPTGSSGTGSTGPGSTPNVTNLADSQFRIVTGLAGSGHGLAGVDQLPRLLPAAPQLRGVGGAQRRLGDVPRRRELLPPRRAWRAPAAVSFES